MLAGADGEALWADKLDGKCGGVWPRGVFGEGQGIEGRGGIKCHGDGDGLIRLGDRADGQGGEVPCGGGVGEEGEGGEDAHVGRVA